MFPVFGNNQRKTIVRKGLTLVEVLVTVVIVTLVGLSILASIQAGIYFQQSIREENGATRQAADLLDQVRREMFFRLQHQDIDNILIDDRGTARTNDDILGAAEIRFYAPDTDGRFIDGDGQYIREVGLPGSPIPLDLSMLMAEVSVRWDRAGRITTGTQYQQGDDEDRVFDREVVLTTLLAP
jgi:type II secretory pathway pseudopilin PulG